MFGHQNNDQNKQDSDAVNVSPTAPAMPPAQPFNPALPTPGTNFGDNSAPTENMTPPEATPPADLTALPSSPVVSDLLDIKQQALSQLSPLVGHLDQTPEEKFRTTMMMIQASDNQDLVKEAYAAAQQITNEKAKAQALLDIVNEINYFTQHHQN